MIGEPNYLQTLRTQRCDRAIVCGLGRSASELIVRPTLPAGVTTFGVNDGGALFKFDYTVIVDEPAAFDSERVARIANAAPMVLTVHNDWCEIRGARPTKLVLSRTAKPPQNIPWYSHHLQRKVEPRMLVAMTSVMSAAWLAVFMGAKQVGIIGVDLWLGSVFEPDSDVPHALDTDELRRRLISYWAWFAREAWRTQRSRMYNLVPGGVFNNGDITQHMRMFTLSEFLEGP